MSDQATPLEHILAHQENIQPDLRNATSQSMKHAARFWHGTTAYKMNKAECQDALTQLFPDSERLRKGLESLPANHRKILSVVRRYGAISGSLLMTELRVRKLIDKPDRRNYYTTRSRR